MKRAISMFMAAILICSLALIAKPLPAHAESLYVRKIVSVVYDDSTSMEGDKWAFANYAMQTFCGMMNSEDQLFITYMNDSKSLFYSPYTADLSSSGIQASVDSIRDHSSTGSTPFKSVEIAEKKLKVTKDDNPNTQYWLVIITDGVFNEMQSGMSQEEAVRMLNNDFRDFTSLTMHNGSNPKVTFLSIGDFAYSPDEDINAGIYTYHAANAKEIEDTMSKMADRISGRTRLDQKDITQVNETTLRVESPIPLLNVVTFVQKSGAKVVSGLCNNEYPIPVSRSARISYPGYNDLNGSACMMGDSQTVIGAGTYELTFDGPIDLDNVVILFEPALEARIKVTVNGREIADYNELNDLTEGDEISAVCKIYEMGTDNEISPSLLPPDTKYSISIAEDGNIVVRCDDESMALDSYILKNLDTELFSSIQIEGFNPITFNARFTPSAKPAIPVYSITAEFENNLSSIRESELPRNKDLVILFTFYADGEQISDPEEVKALHPVLTSDPSGFSGDMEYTPDGKLRFTPNSSNSAQNIEDSLSVTITCTIDDGTSASETFTILMTDYQVIPIPVTDSIVKTEFYGNTVGAEFYVTKEGVKLPRTEVENRYTVDIDDDHGQLLVKTSVSEDGTITCVPYENEEYVLNFGRWLVNWIRYIGISNKDVEITLNHNYGTATNTIRVTRASAGYELKNVYLPLASEVLLLGLLLTYLIRVLTKPKFSKSTALYTGSLSQYGSSSSLLCLDKHVLNKYNTLSKILNPFVPVRASVGGVRIEAAKYGKIICREDFPWYSSLVAPNSPAQRAIIHSPSDIAEYCSENSGLVIKRIGCQNVIDDADRTIDIDDSTYYFVDVDHDRASLISATVFCYTTVE